MKGYGVHLLFHLLAVVSGGAAGVAAGLWWFAANAVAMWIATAALVVGIIVLILEGLYISGVQNQGRPPRPARRPRRTDPPTYGRPPAHPSVAAHEPSYPRQHHYPGSHPRVLPDPLPENEPPPAPEPDEGRYRGGSRADFDPAQPPSVGGDTRVQPSPQDVDQETRKSAAEALKEWSANHRS
ncbi:hypothetical protein A8924_2340 [Saccharopolyspora erythraea NRRL 2338]|uniref:Uncharacterized protein n=2 Tax=Saccharopolyspora erythraea TaxID=1836 RepID=A4FB27_SACEN|nr:hypothetical protein [Saccharopolyspora erythraea]EQD87650.1 hypothetical protein N599_03675 [Saccharopolyspora erythraea D]PFG95034.1 hypothetical protein A8924_2340 [Saccharopolyspora erythraea NRRL 2338]QRK91723.1 hypothetical protein JQX30_10260 [Saccharopolyspora erythraea]CAM01252.1 hypothetical protein SACE_1941 [Saccharopolyspora erythraea NRRL 2338]